MAPVKRPVEDRFWEKVAIAGPDECWEWQACRSKDYGKFIMFKGESPKQAHRVAWELTKGPIPPGLMACHRCDNPPCVNPAHIFLGTCGDNLRDMAAKGRQVFQVHPEKHISSPGERNGMAKITDAQAEEIKRLWAAGGRSQADIGAQFGIRQGQVSRIISGARRGDGSYVPRQKRLTAAEKDQIRVRYPSGGVRQTDLAREFGVTQGAISYLLQHPTPGSEV